MEGATRPSMTRPAQIHESEIRLRDGLGFSFLVFIVLRVAVSVVSVVAVGTVKPPAYASDPEVRLTRGWHNAIDATDRWDARRFERIAEDGYDPSDASAAFFPGYPLTIRALTSTQLIGTFDAALIISNVAFLCALTVLFALTSAEFSTDAARRTLILLASFPVSFFFLSPYSESLFLLTSLLAFWWARRADWGRAGVAGFLAAGTRAVGILIVPALLAEALTAEREHRGRAIAAALLPALAPLTYAFYWFARTGDALRPFHAQDSWFRTLAVPIVSVANAVWLGITGVTDQHGIYWTIDLILTAAVLVPLVLRWRIIPRPYLVYVVASVLVILSYPLPARPLLSAPRFLIVLFPAFWALADLATGRRLVIVTAAFSVGFIIMTAIFVNWGFLF
jgi:hypothetical protein